MGGDIRRTRSAKVRFEPGVFARMERQAQLMGMPVSQLIAFWATQGLRAQEAQEGLYERVAAAFSPEILRQMLESRPPEAER